MHKLTAENAGCWFDCARGQYIGVEVIREAQCYGWDKGGYAEEDCTPDAEWYYEAWDAAEQYLNSICPDGFWIGNTESGDFGMWESEEE